MAPGANGKRVGMNDTIINKPADAYLIPTANGPVYVHINFNERGPEEVFVNMPPIGEPISVLARALGIMISKYIQAGGNVQSVIKHLGSITWAGREYWEGKEVNSIPHAIALALEDHLSKRAVTNKGEKS